jgi:hypothetical protein
MDLKEMLINILLSSGILITLGVWGFNKLKEIVENTETKLDDVGLKSFLKLANTVLDENDLGKVEKVTRKILDKVREQSEDTTEVENKIEEDLNELEKK